MRKPSAETTHSQRTDNALPFATPGRGEIVSPDTEFERRIKRLCGRWILGKRCAKDHIRDKSGSIRLYLPDKTLDSSNWVSILMVSSGCRHLTQSDLAEMRKDNLVLQKWPEYGSLRTRYMHQVSPLLWVINEVLMDDGDLHMIDPYVVLQPRG